MAARAARTWSPCSPCSTPRRTGARTTGACVLPRSLALGGGLPVAARDPDHVRTYDDDGVRPGAVLGARRLVDPRPDVARPHADGRRARPALGRAQWRDLQSRRASPGARLRGGAVLLCHRHRGHPAGLCSMGRRGRHAAPRDVRLRPLRRHPGPSATRAGEGSPRDQAALLLPGRRAAGLGLRGPRAPQERARAPTRRTRRRSSASSSSVPFPRRRRPSRG